MGGIGNAINWWLSENCRRDPEVFGHVRRLLQGPVVGIDNKVPWVIISDKAMKVRMLHCELKWEIPIRSTLQARKEHNQKLRGILTKRIHPIKVLRSCTIDADGAQPCAK